MGVLVGVDWGCGAHAVCVIDANGRVLDRFEVGHDRKGLAALLARLKKHGAPRAIPVAIERPSGLLVDALVEAGFVVTPLHPNLVKACRPRYRAVSAKSDPGDAYILADVLRTDGHRLRPLEPQSDAIKALRGSVRGRDDLVATRVALANQLTALLGSFWPGAAAIGACPPAAQGADRGADVASPIALAFLERYPTPDRPSASGPSAWPASSPSTNTAAAARPRLCSGVCAAPPTAVPAKPKAKPRENWCAPWRARCKPWSPKSPSSPAASSTRSPPCPMAGS